MHQWEALNLSAVSDWSAESLTSTDDLDAATWTQFPPSALKLLFRQRRVECRFGSLAIKQILRSPFGSSGPYLA